MNLFADLAEAIDPVRMAWRSRFTPYPWQERVLRSESSQIILNCSRQAGKSTVTSLLPLHTAIHQANSLTIIASPSVRQSKLLLDKVYESLGRLTEREMVEADNTLYCKLSNGSEIYALPGKEGTIRGFSDVDLLVLDEASRITDATYHAVRPMLAASQGKLVLLSSPFGKRGFFYREWSEGGLNWERVEVTAAECPHIPADFLDEERRALPPELYAQEYECAFVDTLDQIFTHELVSGLMSDDVAPLFGGDSTCVPSLLSDPNLAAIPSF